MTGFDASQVGIGAVFTVVVLREVFAFLKWWSGKRNGKLVDYCVLAKQVAELHKWHDKEDSEGVKLWYVRRSLEEAIDKLAGNIGMQTDLFRTMQVSLHDMQMGIERLLEKR